MKAQDIIAIAALGILITAVLLGSALFQSLLDNPRAVFLEKPLLKNRNISFAPGENYTYSYMINGTEQADLTYVILEGPGCTGIRVAQEVNGTRVCVDEWGVDESGSNVSLSNPSILFFRPWMLALRDGWTWENSMFMAFEGGARHISDNRYRVIRMENYSGRESYVVEISSDAGGKEYQWVDAEKRILLKSEGQGYSVVLRG
ncbi:MAG: hypothetical protein AB1324_02365 [Candidatus Micrarchaeota archaeon]